MIGSEWHPQVFAYRDDIIIATDFFDKHLWLLKQKRGSKTKRSRRAG